MLGIHLGFGETIDWFQKTLRKLDSEQIERLADGIERAYRQNRSVYVCTDQASLSALFTGQLTDSSGEQSRLRPGPLDIVRLTQHSAATGIDIQTLSPAELKQIAGPSDLLLALSPQRETGPLQELLGWAGRRQLDCWRLTGQAGRPLGAQPRTQLVRVPLVDPAMVGPIQQLILAWVMDDVAARRHKVGRYRNGRLAAPLSMS